MIGLAQIFYVFVCVYVMLSLTDLSYLKSLLYSIGDTKFIELKVDQFVIGSVVLVTNDEEIQFVGDLNEKYVT